MAGRVRGNGQGSVRKLPSGKFQALLVLGVDRSGKRREKSAGTFATKRDADKALAKMITEREQGTLNTSADITLAEYAAKHLARRTHLDARTLEIYQLELGYALELLGERTLQSVRPDQLKDALLSLSQRTMTRGRGTDKPMSARTLGKVITHLKALFKEALEDRLIYQSPAESLKKPKGTSAAAKTVGRVLTLTQLERLVHVGSALHAVGVSRSWPALFTAASLGLRRGEVMGLTWAHLDFEQDQVIIAQAQTRAGGKPRIGHTKTEGSQRTVFMPPSLKRVLKAHFEAQQLERAYAREAWTDTGAVFATALGNFTHSDNLVRSLSSVLEWTDPAQLERRLKSLAKGVSESAVQHLRQVVLAGEKLPMLSPHDLRHTYATVALIRGVPAEVVSKVLGHARVSTTLDIYRHVLDTERRRAAIDLFEEVLPVAPAGPTLRPPLSLN